MSLATSKIVNNKFVMDDSWNVPIAFFVGIAMFFVLGPIADGLSLYPFALSLILAFVGAPLIGLGLGFSYKLSILEQMDRDSENIAKEYLMLSKEDKKEFPKGILEALAEPHLTYADSLALKRSMKETLALINERYALKASMRRRNIDVSSKLQYLEQRQAGLKSDVETYREFV